MSDTPQYIELSKYVAVLQELGEYKAREADLDLQAALMKADTLKAEKERLIALLKAAHAHFSERLHTGIRMDRDSLMLAKMLAELDRIAALGSKT